MPGAKNYSETRKTKGEPFVENWMGTTLVLRFLLKSRPSQAKIHNIITPTRASGLSIKVKTLVHRSKNQKLGPKVLAFKLAIVSTKINIIKIVT